MKKYLILILLFMFIFLVNIVNAERTPTTETICNDGVCTQTLYSGIKYVYEDKEWKDIREARSLKDKGFTVKYLETDPLYDIEIIDFNYTSIQFKPIIKDEKELNKDIPIKINEIQLSSVNYDSLLKEETISFKLDNVLNKNFTVGAHSTTIALRANDTEILEGAYAYEGQPDINQNGAANNNWNYRDSAGGAYRTYFMIDISTVPVGATILNATFSGYMHNSDGSSTGNIYRVYGWKGLDETTLTWNNQPCGTAFNDATYCNLTNMDSQPDKGAGWYEWRVEHAVRAAFIQGDNNVSLVVKEPNENGADASMSFYSEEYGDDTTLTPVMNITYQDITNPSWKSNRTNFTSIKKNDIGQFNITVEDNDVGIDSVILLIKNDTSDWENYSKVTASGSTSYDIAFNMSISLTKGQIQYWKFYFNDTDSNINETDIFSIEVSGSQPVLSNTNATTTTTEIISDRTNPTNNNSWVNFTVDFTDVDQGEIFTVYFCKTDNYGFNCTSGQWCESTANLSQQGNSLSCQYNIADDPNSNYSYYAFVVDNSSLVSESLGGNFSINHPPDPINLESPTNRTLRGLYNYTLLEWNSSKEDDEDNVTYKVFGGIDIDSENLSLLYSGSNGTFNWTDLNSSEEYYWYVYSEDEHGYSVISNLSINKFYMDYVGPVLNHNRTSLATVTIGNTLYVYINITDDGSNVSSVTFTYRDPNLNIFADRVMTLDKGYNNASLEQRYSFQYTATTPIGTWDIMWYNATDYLGNKNSLNGTALSFIVESATTTPSEGGGGGGGPSITQLISAVSPNISLVGICGNYKCEEGENFRNCPSDCRAPNIDTLITCIWTEESCIWGDAWVGSFAIWFLVGFIVISLYLGTKKTNKRRKKKRK